MYFIFAICHLEREDGFAETRPVEQGDAPAWSTAYPTAENDHPWSSGVSDEGPVAGKSSLCYIGCFFMKSFQFKLNLFKHPIADN